MKKKIFKLVGSVAVISILLGTKVAFSEPGTSQDPLISKSYVDGKLEDLKDYIDKKLRSADSSSQGGSSQMEIVELRAGQSLIGSSGTEIILRSGRALAIGSNLGGLSDITAGVDLGESETIKQNHLIIVPRTDGRGVYSLGETFFMVRGDYTLE